MHEFTLESGACPACATQNSKHIDACHACGKPLPWAGEEARRQASRAQTEVQLRRGRGNAERAALMIVGALVFVLGIFLWCGNVFGFYPTFGGTGYVTAIVGGALFKWGNND